MPLRHHARAPPGAYPARGANHPCLSLLQRSPAFFGVVVQGKGFFGGATQLQPKVGDANQALRGLILSIFSTMGSLLQLG